MKTNINIKNPKDKFFIVYTKKEKEMKLRELAALVCAKQKKNKAGKELTIAECMSFLKALKDALDGVSKEQFEAGLKLIRYCDLKAFFKQ